jgi:methionyl-tRNA formyltransferase
VALVRRLAPDAIFVLGFSQLVPKEILNLPPKGVIGCHSTLLPTGRGRHPLIWALVKGLEESGTTFLYLDDGVDSGDILMQKRFTIRVEDDARSVYEKDKACAAAIIRETLPLLERGTAPRTPQDHSRATYWPKRTYRDGIIDWSRPAMETYNLIRALTRPYPGASTYSASRELKVWKAKSHTLTEPSTAEVGGPAPEPGTVLWADAGRLVVATRDVPLTIVDYEFVDRDCVTSPRVGGRLDGAEPRP